MATLSTNLSKFYSIDLSVACFGALDVHATGRIPVTWDYISFGYANGSNYYGWSYF